tara:strand:+ start:143 stop:703 length:561 start_codon:yes stop_codon:yes gene_type:complete
MSSTIGVQNIAHTNGTNAMTIDSSGGTTFTSIPFNSVIETWYYNADESHNSGTALDSTWTRRSASLVANKNVGISVNNGIFTFPSTGIWNVTMTLRYKSTGASNYTAARLMITVNNSSYSPAKLSYVSDGASGKHNTSILTHVMNVTDISNQKLYYDVETQHAILVEGGEALNATEITFIKLCPSV